MTAKIVACANMKGGVGKTTVAVSFAEGSMLLGKRVLVIDLDLQMNASMTLVSDSDGMEPWHRDQTVEDYMRARVRGQNPQPMRFVQQIDEQLYLLSGKLSLALFERDLLTQNTAIFTVANHIGTWLKELLTDLRGYFDLVVIDTPPGLSILAECAVREADLIVVPQAPDRLSTQGIQAYAIYLTRYLGLNNVGQKTAVFINMQPNPLTNVARRNLKRIAEMAGQPDFPYRLFESRYLTRTAFRDAMERNRPEAFDQLWTICADDVLAATRELWTLLGKPVRTEDIHAANG